MSSYLLLGLISASLVPCTFQEESQSSFERLRERVADHSLPPRVRLKASQDLYELVKTTGTVSEQLMAIAGLGFRHFDVGDLQSAEAKLTELEARIDQVTDENIQHRLHLLKGLICTRKNDFKQATRELVTSLQIAQRLQDDNNIAKSSGNLGGVLKQVGAYDQAAQHYRLGSEAARRANSSYYLALCQNNLAYLLIELGRLDEAQAVYEQVDVSSVIIRIAVQAGFAHIEALGDEPKRARDIITEIEETHAEVLMPVQRGVLDIIVARSYRAEGNSDQARQALESASEQLAGHRRQPEAQMLLAELELEAGNQEPALTILEAIDLRQTPAPTRQKIQTMLSRLYSARDDYKNAYRFQAEALEFTERRLAVETVLADELQKITVSRERTLRELATKAEKANAERAIADLKAADTKKLMRAEQERHTSEQRLWFAILIGGPALCVAAYSAVALYRRQRREALLKEREQTLNADLGKLLERKRQEFEEGVRERAQLERNLDYKHRAESIGLMTSNLAHDFNNLLQVILHANGALLKNQAVTARERRLLEVSNQTVRTGAGFLRQLLMFARSSEGEPQHFEVSEFLEQHKRLIEAATDPDTRLVLVDRSPAGTSLQVHDAHMVSSLINLVANASTAMPDGGTVTLAVNTLSLDELHRQSGWHGKSNASNFVVFVVDDEGVGMTDQIKAECLAPFVTTRLEQGGTGLGLASVRDFVERSDGLMAIRDSESGGASVALALPETRAALPRNAAIATPVAGPEAGQILVVEDNPDVCEAISVLMTRLGYDSDVVQTPAKALTCTQSRDYDLLLIDVHIPGHESGVALANRIRAKKPTQHIILMSANPPVADHGYPILLKPFTDEALIRAMNDMPYPSVS